jgi:hypothetical protein
LADVSIRGCRWKGVNPINPPPRQARAGIFKDFKKSKFGVGGVYRLLSLGLGRVTSPKVLRCLSVKHPSFYGAGRSYVVHYTEMGKRRMAWERF